MFMFDVFTIFFISGLLTQIEATTGARTFFEPRDSKVMNAMLVDYYAQLDEPRGKAILVAVCRGGILIPCADCSL